MNNDSTTAGKTGNTGENGVNGSKVSAMAGPVPTIAAKDHGKDHGKAAVTAKPETTPAKPLVTTETHGQGILHRVEKRKKEFEQKIAAGPNDPARDPSHAAAIEAALHAVEGLLTGNLKDIEPTTAAELSLWLESSKHLSNDEPQADGPAAHKAQPKTTTKNFLV